ncbi:MAG TPA: beta-galactosidase GalA [Candidatus Acidoferrales bacterium]|nr:beta-galactosidase GalA [Candidatus Acidoferrales bacterium]
MKHWSRRDLLKFSAKLGALAPAAAHAFASESVHAFPGAPSFAQSAKGGNNPSLRERILFDSGWRFHFGHASDPSKDFNFGGGDYGFGVFAKTGYICLPAFPNFDDSAWQPVDLPHDFVVALPFVNAPELNDWGYKPVGRNFPETSIGWYRRVFEIPQSDAGRRVSLEFDGVFRNAMVILNGIYLGRNLSGYAPFRFDVTDFVCPGEKNILVVRVDATEHEGWFYEGGGIYRHVWLTKTNPLHIAHEGVYVTSQISGNSAQISAVAEVVNDSDTEKSFQFGHAVFDSVTNRFVDGISQVVSLSPWATQQISQTFHIDNPSLWSPDNPHLYRLFTAITANRVLPKWREVASLTSAPQLDSCETYFGIRSIHFDADHGFFLNGQRVEIKGMCNHQDHAGVGSALPDRLQYFRIAKLKEMGVNAYRTSHNPPTPALLDACDRLGMLVMDETRMFSSSSEGLSQLERMVRRDRNHPCIFLWSIGNEEPLQGTPTGERIAATMINLVHKLDSSRPVTLAMNNNWGHGASAAVDIQGCNYFHNGDIDKFHSDFPRKPIIGSEEASAICTRGIYANDPAHGFMSAYDVNTPGSYASTAEQWWNFFAARPFAAGAFVWTGFDYRGEPSPYKWPCISSHFGVMDTCGFPKDTYFYYQAQWSDKTVLHLFPHWNWQGREGQPIAVWVYSNCDEVELFLNGKSLGRKSMPPRGHLEWQVNYAPGALLARGYKNGKPIAEESRETTGSPAQIKLVPDRASIAADAQDVSVITVSILDSQNRVVPVADNEVTFEIDGPRKIIGVGNGDPSSHEPDRPPSQLYDSHGALLFASHSPPATSHLSNVEQDAVTRKVFNGLAQLIVQSQNRAGDIRISARAEGLSPASITIHFTSRGA